MQGSCLQVKCDGCSSIGHRTRLGAAFVFVSFLSAMQHIQEQTDLQVEQTKVEQTNLQVEQTTVEQTDLQVEQIKMEPGRTN